MAMNDSLNTVFGDRVSVKALFMTRFCRKNIPAIRCKLCKPNQSKQRRKHLHISQHDCIFRKFDSEGHFLWEGSCINMLFTPIFNAI